MTMDAFNYPRQPHIRRHGPEGYVHAESFRPWLRDEFAFRCVYCLLREQWGLVKGIFGVDHFLPVTMYPTKALDYDNLLYACVTCNGAKGTRPLPNPETAFVSEGVQVREDGNIEAKSRDARRLIRVLGLDDPEYTDFRMLWIGIVALAKKHDQKLFRKLMGYPDDVPNLASLRPPKGNRRPEGLEIMHFTRRQQRTLPETY